MILRKIEKHLIVRSLIDGVYTEWYTEKFLLSAQWRNHFLLCYYDVAITRWRRAGRQVPYRAIHLPVSLYLARNPLCRDVIYPVGILGTVRTLNLSHSYSQVQ